MKMHAGTTCPVQFPPLLEREARKRSRLESERIALARAAREKYTYQTFGCPSQFQFGCSMKPSTTARSSLDVQLSNCMRASTLNVYRERRERVREKLIRYQSL